MLPTHFAILYKITLCKQEPKFQNGYTVKDCKNLHDRICAVDTYSKKLHSMEI